MPATEINVQQIYIAYYGRPADPAGLAFWTTYFSATDNLDEALAAFGASAEFTDRYGELSPTELVNGLYRQLFNRDAEPQGLAFYRGQLDSGEATLASIALDIASGAENSDRAVLDNKIAVATHCADEITATADADYGAAEIDVAQALLAAVGATVGSLRAGIVACDNEFGFIPEPPAPDPVPVPAPPPPPRPGIGICRSPGQHRDRQGSVGSIPDQPER